MTIIVIDPGHGGENEGGKTDNYTEKDLTIIVAKAMKEQLEKYDDVTVYLTRESDVTLEIADRLAMANEVHADFFVSLHFNMSANHDTYGFEVWLPSHADLYKKAYPFAKIIHDDYTSGTYDLYSRGIKTRLGRQGDYYGVIRYGTEYGIPSVIVEHAHMDQANDNRIIPTDNLTNSLYMLGVRDAEAMAKAMHLKSSSLGRDYSSYALPTRDVSGIVAPDETPAETCIIELTGRDEEAGKASVHIEAADQGSYLIYYRYSVNGGESWSELFPWSRSAWNVSDPSMDVEIDVPGGRECDLSFLVYNSFDRITESNHIILPAAGLPEEEEDTEEELLDEEGEEDEAGEALEEEETEESAEEDGSKASETSDESAAGYPGADEGNEVLFRTGKNTVKEDNAFYIPDLTEEVSFDETESALSLSEGIGELFSKENRFYTGMFLFLAFLVLVVFVTMGVSVVKQNKRRRRRKKRVSSDAQNIRKPAESATRRDLSGLRDWDDSL